MSNGKRITLNANGTEIIINSDGTYTKIFTSENSDTGIWRIMKLCMKWLFQKTQDKED